MQQAYADVKPAVEFIGEKCEEANQWAGPDAGGGAIRAHGSTACQSLPHSEIVQYLSLQSASTLAVLPDLIVCHLVLSLPPYAQHAHAHL